MPFFLSLLNSRSIQIGKLKLVGTNHVQPRPYTPLAFDPFAWCGACVASGSSVRVVETCVFQRVALSEAPARASPPAPHTSIRPRRHSLAMRVSVAVAVLALVAVTLFVAVEAKDVSVDTLGTQRAGLYGRLRPSTRQEAARHHQRTHGSRHLQLPAPPSRPPTLLSASSLLLSSIDDSRLTFDGSVSALSLRVVVSTIDNRQLNGGLCIRLQQHPIAVRGGAHPADHRSATGGPCQTNR